MRKSMGLLCDNPYPIRIPMCKRIGSNPRIQIQIFSPFRIVQFTTFATGDHQRRSFVRSHHHLLRRLHNLLAPDRHRSLQWICCVCVHAKARTRCSHIDRNTSASCSGDNWGFEKMERSHCHWRFVLFFGNRTVGLCSVFYEIRW